MHHLKINISVLCQYRSHIRQGHSLTCLTQQAKDIGIRIPQDPQELAQEITTVTSAIKKMYAASHSTRLMYLLQKANLAEELAEKNKAKAIRTILRAETRFEAYKILKAIQGKSKASTGIHSLQVPRSWPTGPDNNTQDMDTSFEDPKSATGWRIVHCPQEIQFLLRLQN